MALTGCFLNLDLYLIAGSKKTEIKVKSVFLR
jgi:hypothetical protein